jgi:pseudouridylate synthase
VGPQRKKRIIHIGQFLDKNRSHSFIRHFQREACTIVRMLSASAAAAAARAAQCRAARPLAAGARGFAGASAAAPTPSAASPAARGGADVPALSTPARKVLRRVRPQSAAP